MAWQFSPLLLWIYGGVGGALAIGTIIHGSYVQTKHPDGNYEAPDAVFAGGVMLGAFWPVVFFIAAPLYGIYRVFTGLGRYLALHSLLGEATKRVHQVQQDVAAHERERLLSIPVEDLASEMEQKS